MLTIIYLMRSRSMYIEGKHLTIWWRPVRNRLLSEKAAWRSWGRTMIWIRSWAITRKSAYSNLTISSSSSSPYNRSNSPATSRQKDRAANQCSRCPRSMTPRTWAGCFCREPRRSRRRGRSRRAASWRRTIKMSSYPRSSDIESYETWRWHILLTSMSALHFYYFDLVKILKSFEISLKFHLTAKNNL